MNKTSQKFLALLSSFTLLACTGTDPLPKPSDSPTPTSSPTQGVQPTASPTNPPEPSGELEGCWQDTLNTTNRITRHQYKKNSDGTYALTLTITQNGQTSTRPSTVELKDDGFLVIIGDEFPNETLQWVGEQLIFKISGSLTAVFERCE